MTLASTVMKKYKVRISQLFEAEVYMDAESREQAVVFALEYVSERISMFSHDLSEEMKVEFVMPVKP